MTRRDEDEISDDGHDGVDFEFMTVDSNRLKMFSDAVWAIIATIMIVPLMHSNVTEEINKGHHNMSEIVDALLPHLPIYFLAFLIVCSTWTCHVWTFQIMKHVTDLTIVINLVVLLAASLLPYFYSVMSRFKTTTSVIIYSSLQVFIGIIQSLQVVHGFSYEGLLKLNIQRKTKEQKSELRSKLVRRILVIPIFCILAIILSFVSISAALACLTILLFYPWIQSIIRTILSRIPVCRELAGRRVLTRDVILTERVKKNRLEAFSDGVFAITATILALDISEKHVPNVKTVEAKFGGHVRNALLANWGLYVAYLMMFIVIGLLWFTQLTLFKHMMRISRVMQFFNNLSLACVGVIPLAFTFILHFQIFSSVITGVRIACVAVFCVEFWFSVVYIIALICDRCNREKNDPWLAKRVQPGGSDFWVFMFQLVGLPVGSVIVFGLTFLHNQTISVYVYVAIIVFYTTTVILWRTIAGEFCIPYEPDPRGEFDELPGEDDGDRERLTAVADRD